MGRRSENTIVMSIKMVLMSTGIFSIAIILCLLIPNLFTFATSHLPSLFSTLRTTWFRPPYLYFIINAIIISIVFLHHRHNNHRDPPHKVAVVYHHLDNTTTYDVISVRADDHFSSYDVVSASFSDNNNNNNNNNNVVSVKDVEVVDDDERETATKRVVVGECDHDDLKSTVVERSTWDPPPSTPPLRRQGAVKKELSSGRPPASSGFGGHHRRPAKPTPQGGKALNLKVSKQKKHDTIDSTWKAITEGQNAPLNRHLKKSDTWENHGRQIDVLDDSFPSLKVLKKSETVKERTNYTSPRVTSTQLKKEPSLGQDELNRRVEAFINKFNEDIRLQRQESLQHFMEMINRAA